jgi:hypothetical protein
MKTLKQVPVIPVYVDLIPEILEENKIYISKEYKTSIHNCLCGCGHKVVTPLIDSMWHLSENSKGISLTPSILSNNLDCKSHYIITNNIANFV